MRLSLIIPVRNDAEGLARLLRQLCRLLTGPEGATLAGHMAEVIVVDDASDLPAEAAIAATGLAPALAGHLPPEGLRWLRLPAQGGAGRARNQGLAAARGSHLLFFDSDDLPAPGFPALLAGLAVAPPFDFAMFRHADSRRLPEGVEEPIEPDAAAWQGVMPGLRAQALGGPGGWARLDAAGIDRLSRVSAYPWNKIYDAGFARRAGLRCTEIPVHNDIELHWAGFIAAESLLASPTIGCLHFVAPEGQRLTNRRDADRLRVFEALEAVAARLTPDRAARHAPAFADFCLRLCDWIADRLESPDARAAFEARALAFLHRLGPPALTAALMRNPGLAGPLRRRLRRAG